MATDTDPAVVVRAVRALALDAHQLLKHPDAIAASDLVHRIDELRGQLHVDHSSELARWLDSLRRRVAAA
jgi:hypothetical protein